MTTLLPVFPEADCFLTALGVAPWTFQVFDDKKRSKKAWHWTGTLEEYASILAEKNGEGLGVFVTVNRCNGHGRGKQHVNLVRSMFLDLDGIPLRTVLSGPFKPHIIVQTSFEHWHAYFLIDGCSLDAFDPLLNAMVKRYGTCKGAKGINRVMRLPGFYHQKAEPYLVKVVEVRDHPQFAYREFAAEFLKPTAPAASKNPAPRVTPKRMVVTEGFPGTDDELLNAARRAANGAKFAALFDQGDISGYNMDDSSADCALCAMLAFWCGQNSDRIDRLVRLSALFRPKWDEPRATSTYGEFTIAKVLSKVHRFYTPPRKVPEMDDPSEPAHDTLEELGRSIDALLNTPHGDNTKQTTPNLADCVQMDETSQPAASRYVRAKHRAVHRYRRQRRTSNRGLAFVARHARGNIVERDGANV